MNKNNYIVIMAGGVGSRFWPASRESLPKQFLDILGVGQSLIQLTFQRAIKLVPKENILIATNAKYKQLTLEHLPELDENQILLEPSRNNTAPCVAYALLRIQATNSNATFAVLPSDAVILREGVFVEKMQKAFNYSAKNNALMTLGIQATRPDTGYGYIELGKESAPGIFAVKAFKEKPDLHTAQSYFSSGNYLWNGGIFIWSVSSLEASFSQNASEILDTLSEDKSRFNTPNEQEYIDQVYPLCPSISVDYAILEKADNVYTIPADMGWSDLGTWNSLHDYLPKDTDQNVVQASDAVLDNVENCMIKTDKSKLVVAKDLHNYIIIDEKDALLIFPKNKEQEIKEIRNRIQNQKYL